MKIFGLEEMKLSRLLFVLIPIALLLTVPLYSTGYILAFSIIIFTYIGLAVSWNILSGYTGYVSLGHGAFFGLGAYTNAILMNKYGITPYFGMIIGGIMALIAAIALGSFSLRVRGAYFAIVTLALSEILRTFFINLAWLTGGAEGITVTPLHNLKIGFYLMFIITALAFLTSYKIVNSKFGLSLIAIRENEDAAESLGLNTFRYKLMAFATSAFFPGVIGGFFVWYNSYIDPTSVFTLIISFNMVIYAFFGGAGTLLGPVVGATTLGLISETLWAKFPYFHLILYGLILIFMVLFMPGGLVRKLGKIYKRAIMV